MKQFSFSKNERLASRKQIEHLLLQGKTVFCYPFKVMWLEQPDISPTVIKIAISVAKKRLRHAVQRNTIKRRTREAFRLNKPLFYQQLSHANVSVHCLLIYIGKKTEPYALINKSVVKTIQQLLSEIEQPAVVTPDTTVKE